MTKFRVLVLLAHPLLQRSIINSALQKAILNINGVTVHDLYDSYPEFFINVKTEQQLLLQHDLIVFQHPFYWYSTTPILKLWQDLVLTAGFAYGDKTNSLHGKHFMQVISTGAKSRVYSEQGSNHFTMQQLLAPMKATINMCGMIYLTPLILHHSDKVTATELAKHISQYRETLIQFTQTGASSFKQESNHGN